MSNLIKEGTTLWRRGNVLLRHPDDCCCGKCCCNGPLDCCTGYHRSVTGMQCVNGGSFYSIEVRWQWNFAVGGFCQFRWDINYLFFGIFAGGISHRYNYTEPSCAEPAGTYVKGGQFQLYEFDFTLQPNNYCDFSNATVKVAKSGNGYWFTLQGTENHPTNGLCDDCQALDGSYYADCTVVG